MTIASPAREAHAQPAGTSCRRLGAAKGGCSEPSDSRI